MLTGNLMIRRMLYMAVLSFMLIFSAGYGDTIDWTAYNDCIGSTSANPNTTTFTDYLNYTGDTTGLLKNDTTGSAAGISDSELKT